MSLKKSALISLAVAFAALLLFGREGLPLLVSMEAGFLVFVVALLVICVIADPGEAKTKPGQVSVNLDLGREDDLRAVCETLNKSGCRDFQEMCGEMYGLYESYVNACNRGASVWYHERDGSMQRVEFADEREPKKIDGAKILQFPMKKS